MKRIYTYIICAAAILLAASCTIDNLQTTDGSYISLNLSSKAMDTKATKDGVDELNENTINDVYYFFFKKGETEEAPIVKGRLVGLGHKSGVKTEEVPVASNVVSTLFSGTTECQAFIVANPPKDIETFLSGTPAPTLKALREKMFKTSFSDTQESFTMIYDAAAKQNSPSGNIMTVEVSLRRLASKMTVTLNSAKTFTDANSVVWQSVPAKAKVTFFNAFNETALSGDFDIVKAGDSKYSEKYFNTGAIGFGTPSEQTDNWSCNAQKPIYSYPVSWDFAGNKEPYLLFELPWKNTSTGSETTYYYKVFLDAKELKMNNWCYVTVGIHQLGSLTPDDPDQLFDDLTYMVIDWNNAFATGEGPTADIDDARYLMMNQTRFDLYNQDVWNIPYTSSHECEIVNQEYERMNYRANEAVPDGGDSEDLDNYSLEFDESLITFTHSLENNFGLSHSETNRKGTQYSVGDYDVVEYIFRFTIQHKDDPTYKQDVEIHQFPAIFIVAQANSRGAIVTPKFSDPTVFLNIDGRVAENVEVYDRDGYFQGYSYIGYGGDPYLSRKNDTKAPGNVNGNMYVVTSSIPPTIGTETYLLGDPREYVDQTLTHYVEASISGTSDLTHREPYTNWDTDPDFSLFTSEYTLYGNSAKRTLSYYYPTREDAEVADIIAPKFRVASSWGACTSTSARKAKARCAAYQEDGYPAGRWRLPTAAELLYICKLSSDHMIPMLFGSTVDKPNETTKYWCSTGYVEVWPAEQADTQGNYPINTYNPATYTAIPTGTTLNERCWLRCVYDDWYWENRDVTYNGVTTEGGRLPSDKYNVRYWGDMPR